MTIETFLGDEVLKKKILIYLYFKIYSKINYFLKPSTPKLGVPLIR